MKRSEQMFIKLRLWMSSTSLSSSFNVADIERWRRVFLKLHPPEEIIREAVGNRQNQNNRTKPAQFTHEEQDWGTWYEMGCRSKIYPEIYLVMSIFLTRRATFWKNFLPLKSSILHPEKECILPRHPPHTRVFCWMASQEDPKKRSLYVVVG